ncbi:MAG TPA: hypothetical protein PLQ76_09425, partial [bacterium]|nr:hypothetical protein [bacterium]
MNIFLKDIALLGAQVITDTGMLAGSVHDFAISEKTGEIAQLGLVPERPETPRIDAKHILKITQARIIVSGKSLEEPPPPPPERVRPAAPAPAKIDTEITAAPPSFTEEKKPAMEPAEEQISTDAALIAEFEIEPQKEPEAKQTPRVGRESMSVLQESFLEMTRILIGRLNAIDPSERIDNLKMELLESIRNTGSEKTSDSPDAAPPALELVIEEKIKRAVASQFEPIKEEIRLLAEKFSTAPEVQLPEINIEPPDLSPISKTIRDLEDKLEKTAESIRGALPKNDGTAQLESLKGSLSAVSDKVENLRGQIPAKEDIRKQISDHAKLFEEKSAALQKAMSAELEKHVKSLRDGIAKTEVPAAQQLDTQALENSLRCLIEDFRDQFATQLAVELTEQGNETTDKTLKSFVNEIKKLVEPLSSKADAFIASSADKPGMDKELKEGLKKITAKMEEALEENAAAVKKETDKSLRNAVREIVDPIKANIAETSAIYPEISRKIAGVESAVAKLLSSPENDSENELRREVKAIADGFDSMRESISDALEERIAKQTDASA